MENAAKALLLAGGFLIAILLLTLFNYVFRNMSDSTSDIYTTLDESQISKFNQQFFNYQGRGITEGTTPLTIQDVATLINLAQDSKENPNFRADIKIYLGSVGGTNLTESEHYIDWLEDNKNADTTYNCKEIHVNTTTLLVDYIVIEEHT